MVKDVFLEIILRISFVFIFIALGLSILERFFGLKQEYTIQS